MMEEYNPDSPQEVANLSKKDDPNVKKIQINDPAPYSPDKPRFKIKFEKHKATGVPMFNCPACGFMGRHKATELDQSKTSPYRIGGELCDICGDEDTYELAY